MVHEIFVKAYLVSGAQNVKADLNTKLNKARGGHCQSQQTKIKGNGSSPDPTPKIGSGRK